MENSEIQNAIDEAIFEVALSMGDPAIREQFLRRSFQADPAGLKRMMDLLEASRDSASFFLEARDARSEVASEMFLQSSPPPHREQENIGDPADRTGTVIDGYRLGRCLGEGGSGTVYEAEQRHPVQRLVALKIIRIDTRSVSAQARFDIERQALAIMDHPNIAKVLDAGGIRDGTAYFVMELIEGESITCYCDRERLPIKDRIALFIDICEAIQHAHSKRIIHRDIKPSNILVTIKNGKPMPKVIDFGIAKAMVPASRSNDAFTAHDQFFGTPAYMSPEQVAMIGVDVDTRSDIYSLGALLYEILTSHTPFDRKTLNGSSIAAMRNILQERPHLKPSSKIGEATEDDARVIAAARRTDPARLASSIRGDLDWIVMKALEKDRNHRYETANGLAMDLKRYLENKPVAARRPNNLYSLRKFIQRNKIPFCSAVAVSISILLGFGVSTALYFREKTALAEQARLSREAEKSRDQELHLRRQAQARANVSRAAFLLSEGQVEEADKLIQTNPLKSIEPSREAADVFRALGRWYANYGRWSECVQCFQLMDQANKMTSSTAILRSSDLISTGPAIIELNDQPAYEVFRKEVVGRHLPVANSLEAEHLLKACLLTDTSPALLAKLEQPAALCEISIRTRTENSHLSWDSFSLALYHYRKGNFESVLAVGGLGLTDPGIKEACAASIRALMAVAHQKLGDRENSRADFKKASAMIRSAISKNPGDEVYPSRWYDWSIASHLLDEAERIAARN